MSKMHTAYCKGCHTPIEVPLPDPVKEIVKEPCRCGLTETARYSKYWAIAIPFVVLIIAGSVASTHVMSGYSAVEAEKVRAGKVAEVADERKMKIEQLERDIVKYKTQLEMYRLVIGELKDSSPEVIDKHLKKDK